MEQMREIWRVEVERKEQRGRKAWTLRNTGGKWTENKNKTSGFKIVLWPRWMELDCVEADEDGQFRLLKAHRLRMSLPFPTCGSPQAFMKPGSHGLAFDLYDVTRPLTLAEISYINSSTDNPKSSRSRVSVFLPVSRRNNIDHGAAIVPLPSQKDKRNGGNKRK